MILAGLEDGVQGRKRPGCLKQRRQRPLRSIMGMLVAIVTLRNHALHEIPPDDTNRRKQWWSQWIFTSSRRKLIMRMVKHVHNNKMLMDSRGPSFNRRNLARHKPPNTPKVYQQFCEENYVHPQLSPCIHNMKLHNIQQTPSQSSEGKPYNLPRIPMHPWVVLRPGTTARNSPKTLNPQTPRNPGTSKPATLILQAPNP